MILEGFVLNLVFGMLFLSLVLAFIRLVIGPNLVDRVVALDMMSLIVMGIIATYCIQTDQPVLLDTAVVLALIAFVGAVAFGRYMKVKRSTM
jgi:multicomponent Na+:H+ antiporter subunit F